MKSKLANIGVVCVWVVLWAVIACAVGSPVVLATPAETVQALVDALLTPAFWAAIGGTFWHIAVGLVAACVSGCAMGLAAARWRAFEVFFSPMVHFVKSAPIVCFIVLLLVWFGSSYVDVAAVILAVLPVYFTSMREACSQRDAKLSEMLQLFCVPFWRRVHVFEWPSVRPFFMQSTKVAVGMAWKSGVTAELIGITFASVGEQIYLSKLTLDTAGLFAWTIVIVLLSWLCEKLVLWLVGRIGRGEVVRGLRGGQGERAEATAIEPVPTSVSAQAAAVRIEARNLSKSFGEIVLFSRFSHVFEPGSRTCIMAHTGTGKTTLLNILMGLDSPDEGSVTRAFVPTGTPVSVPEPEHAAMFSAVFQETRLLPRLTAMENVVLASAERRVTQTFQLRAEALLQELVGTHTAQKVQAAQAPVQPVQAVQAAPVYVSAEDLSGGTKRCVELCRALAVPSGCVVLDEPFTGLDDAKKQQALMLVQREIAGRTLILVTHDACDAQVLGCSVIRLS